MIKSIDLKDLKIALVHDWLVGMRGAERCLEVFCDLFPKADIYTLVHKKGSVSEKIESHQIYTSFLQKIPKSTSIYRYLLPLMPTAIEQFDLSEYDLVLSASSCVAKGVVVPHDVPHISWIHSPMRYAWDMYQEYFGEKSGLPRWKRFFIPPQINYIRMWDVISTNRVDYLYANSKHVADRVKCVYRRDVDVLYPPVKTDTFNLKKEKKDFYLMVTGFAPNKRIDLAIHAFNELGLPLKIVGSHGRLKSKMEKLASSNIEFLGWQEDSVIKGLYGDAKAFIFPGVDDFGITPLESMASGTPVIAYGKGGALETVVPVNSESFTLNPNNLSPTGVFFYEPTVESLIKSVKFFESIDSNEWNRESMNEWAETFSESRFKKDVLSLVSEKFEEFNKSRRQSNVYKVKS